MSILTKTQLIIVATLLGLTAMLYGALRFVVLDSFLVLEDRSVRENVGRASDAFAGEIDALNRVATDYSNWDQNYAAMANPDELLVPFVATQLKPEGLVRLEVNYVVFANLEGKKLPAVEILEQRARQS